MRVYQNADAKKLEKIICNKCGKEIQVYNGIPQEEVFEGQKIWGYFSKKDGSCDHFDLCEDCYDELTAGFQIPAEREETIELL